LFRKTPLKAQNDSFLDIWGVMAPLSPPWLRLCRTWQLFFN